jgi:hypothetical protein
LTEKSYWEEWDIIDAQNALIFAKPDKEDLDYIFEKDLSNLKLGDTIK